jgi:hypothetical protein
VFFCALPTLLLGITNFLLTEYVRGRFGASIPFDAVAYIRVGQTALFGICGFIAIGCGVLLSSWYVRPLRALLRVVEGGGGGPIPETYIVQSDPVLRRLFQRILTMLQQNRTGEQAILELATIRRQMDLVRRAAGPRPGRLPLSLRAGGTREPSHEGELIREVDRLLRGIRIELEDLHERIGAILLGLEADSAHEVQRRARIDEALIDVESHGTVWSLEIERMRRGDPSIPGTLGSCFSQFVSGIESLRAILRSGGPEERTVAEAMAELHTIRERIDEWVHGEAGVDTAGDLAPTVK